MSRDPTGTGRIRAAWKTDARVRLKKAEGAIIELVSGAQGVGLGQTHYKQMLDRYLSGDWPKQYVRAAFNHGSKFAWSKLKGPFSRPSFETERQLQDKLANKAIGDMSNVIEETASQLANRLHGEDPKLAVSIVKDRMAAIAETRSNAVVASNVVGAHAAASLLAYKYAGVNKVGVDVESIPRSKHLHAHVHDAPKVDPSDEVVFVTAGDDLVCPECSSLEGQVYTVDEADGIIPVHPNCRCAFLPNDN